MAAASGRVLARAPADATLGHCGIARSGHVAAASGGGLRDVRHLARRHRRNGHNLAGRKAHLTTVCRASTVGGVGANVIGRVGRQASHVHRVAARARAAADMAAANGRGLARAPADAALSHLATTVICHVAAAGGCGLCDVRHLARRHRRLIDADRIYNQRLALSCDIHIAAAWLQCRQRALPNRSVVDGKSSVLRNYLIACRSFNTDGRGNGFFFDANGSEPVGTWSEAHLHGSDG